MTENWYLVLELEFAPNPVKDEAKIKEAIDQKTKFWSTKANDFAKGPEYRKYLDCARKGVIAKDMIGPDNIRDELIEDAKDKVYGPIDKILKNMRKTEFTTGMVSKIADKLKKEKVTVDMVTQRIKILGYKIVESDDEDYQKLYKKYYQDKPKGYDLFKDNDKLLATFKCETLYDFLNDIKIDKIKSLSIDRYHKLIEEKKKLFVHASAESGTGQKLCANCTTIFKDEESKKNYDDFLLYRRRVAVLDDLKSNYELIGDIDDSMLKDSINKLVGVLGNREQANQVIVAFCKCEKIPVSLSSTATKEDPRVKLCRCGFSNDVSDGRKKCANCGMDLVLVCPNCGKENDNYINVCSCNFRLDSVDKVVALCSYASIEIDNLNFEVVKAYISDAEKIWPKYEKITEVKTKLAETQARVGALVKELNAALEKKNFYESKNLFEKVRKFYPKFSNPAVENGINTAISTAESFKKKALSSTNIDEIIDACTKAYESCSDCPGIREIIAKYPLSKPANLSVAPNPKSKCNLLSWSSDRNSGNVYYIVVRKEGSVPISVQDGTLIAKSSVTNCADNKIKAGAQYFYAIFAERAGIFSSPLVTEKPVENYFEIENVDITSGDGFVQISWGAIEENAVVRIERSHYGRKTMLDCRSRNRFIDENLTNDQEYQYKVFIEYNVGGRLVRTAGIVKTATPTPPPRTVDKVSVKAAENGEYQIQWSNPDRDDIKFFYSKTKAGYTFGDLISLSKLQAEMEPLMVVKQGTESGKFTYKGTEPIYIFPVIEKAGSCVIGAFARTSSGGNIKIRSVNLVNGKILIVVDPPQKYDGFLVLYRNDRYAEDLDDEIGTSRKQVLKKQYEHDGGIYIDSAENKDYFITVYAMTRVDGEIDYSAGSDYLFSNCEKQTISYSVEVSKGFIGGKSVILNFDANGKRFNLPDIDVMYKTGTIPMFKDSATLLHHIDGVQNVVVHRVKISIPKQIGSNTYIKAFISGDGLNDRYQLSLKAGSNLKIN